MLLPSEVGARVRAEGGLGKINAEGLDKEGDSYVNGAYGDSKSPGCRSPGWGRRDQPGGSLTPFLFPLRS